MWQNSNEEVLLKVSSGQIVSDFDLNRRLPSITKDGFAERHLGCDPTLKARARHTGVFVVFGVS